MFSHKMLVIRAGTHKMSSEMQTGKTLIRLLLQKQSDMGLPGCLGPFGRQLVFNFFRPLTMDKSHMELKYFDMCR